MVRERTKLIEFNVRLGDPEAQVLAIQDKRDWGKLIASKLGLYHEGLEGFELDTQRQVVKASP